jgi:hypothetical protein
MLVLHVQAVGLYDAQHTIHVGFGEEVKPTNLGEKVDHVDLEHFPAFCIHPSLYIVVHQQLDPAPQRGVRLFEREQPKRRDAAVLGSKAAYARIGTENE